MRKFHKKRIIPVGLSRLHTNLINLGSKIQIKSEEKFQKEKHIGAMIHEAFTRIIAYAIILHRGIYSLCKEGWTSLTPLLL
ncbi:MAG: hypothetical protein J7L26_04375, partial [Candidatus Aminicenantes bacterium]|nr:hypothetical protein [Candidatus Aminicenantes bacterium]